MKKLSILLMSAFLAVANETNAYELNLVTETHGTVISSHSTADAGQIVTLLATPENDFSFFYNMLANRPITVQEPSGIILNGEGTTFDGWTKTEGNTVGWAIFEGNAFATSFQLATLEQTNSLTDLGFSEAQLDASPTFTATVDMWVYSQGANIASAVVTMLDENGNTLETVTVVDDTSGHDWQTYTKAFTLVAGTRQLKYTLKGQSAVYWEGLYGPRFRNVDVRTSLQPASKSATTRCLRFVMPTENVTVMTYFEPANPDAAVDDNLLAWTSYRRHFNGKGTAENPFTIENAAQLAQLAYDVRNGCDYKDKIFVQTADIDLNKTVNGERVQWVPIGGFIGTKSFYFDGHFFGHQLWGDNATNRRWIVKNMYINHERIGNNNEYLYCGLFGFARGVLRDITISNADISWNGSSSPRIGLLCGNHYSSYREWLYMPSIWGCSVQGSINVTASASYAGGIVGEMNSYGTTAIEQCKADVSITNVDRVGLVGGIAGLVTGVSISDCTARVNISCDATGTRGRYGGIVGCVEHRSSHSFVQRNVINACTVSGSMTCLSATTGSENHVVGGIVGEVEQTLVSSCVSMVSMSGNGKMGGITGRLQANNSDIGYVEHNVFAGHIDGSTAEQAAGIIASVMGSYDLHISNNLMIGTISMGTNAANCYAIVASLLNDKSEASDPLVAVANCYYDTILCGAQALPPIQRPHPTVAGCPTDILTSGKQADLRFLMSDDNKGFTFTKNYYPKVVSSSHWLLLADGEYLNRYQEQIDQFDSRFASYFGSDAMKFMWKDASTDDGTVRPMQYTAGAWLASLPATITKGDFAYDFVSSASVKQQAGIFNERSFNAETQEWEDKELRRTNTVAIPGDADCIKVNGLTVTAVKQGSFDVTLGILTLTRPFHFDITSLNRIWDGTMASGFRWGEGTEANPYIIRTPQELAYAVNNSQQGKYYHQICDLRLNARLLNDQFRKVESMFEPPSAGTLWYKNTEWKGHYNGTGHIVRGMYAYVYQDDSNCNYGLFGKVNRGATVENLGIADALMQSQLPGNSETCQGENTAMGVIAGICDGTIRNCLAQGAVNGMQVLQPLLYNEMIGRPVYIGGLCGRVGSTASASDARVEDCVAAVSLFEHSSVAGAFVSRLPSINKGKVQHCLALSPIFLYGPWAENRNTPHTSESEMLDDSDCLIDCHYPRGYRFSFKTVFNDEDIAELNEHFGQSALWQTEEKYYPMLKTFASTAIGKMLTLPFSPPENDYLLRMNAMTTFTPGNLNWEIYLPANDYTFFELDSDMGVITPMQATGVEELLNYEYFLAGTTPDGSDVHIVGISPNMGSVQKGITFVDENARNACLLAFDRNRDDVLTLSEVASVTNDEILNAFQNQYGRAIRNFPELCYFKAVTSLTTQLNGMSSLESVTLPFALTSVLSDAFNGCTSLKEVTLPAKVSTVDGHPFYGSAVENIYVDKFNEDFKSRDGVLFDMDNRLVAYPNGRTGSATLSGDISEIMPSALYQLTDCDTVFIDAPNYWDVIYLHENGIATESGNLPLVYINDATYDQTLLDSYLDDESWWDYAVANRLGRYYPLNVTSAKAATFYIGFDTDLPDSLTPYIVTTTDEDEKVAYLTRLTDNSDKKTRRVPKLTPVVIFADAQGLYKLLPSSDQLAPFPMWKNLLNGSDRDGMPVYQEDVQSGNVLTLGRNSSGTLGFFYYTGEKVPPYRAYLTFDDITEAKAFILKIDDDVTLTGIENVTATATPQNDQYYTISGQRVTKQQMQKGIYIVNGKKILVK